MSSAFQVASAVASRSSTLTPSASRCSRAAWQYGHPGLTYMTTPIAALEGNAAGAGSGGPGREAAVRGGNRRPEAGSGGPGRWAARRPDAVRARRGGKHHAMSEEPTPVDGETLKMPGPEVRGTVFPPTLHEAHRRPLGLEPAAVLALAGGIALLSCVILFAAGAWIAAVILLGVSCGLGALFLVAVGREPETRLARWTLRTLARAGALRRLAAVAARAWWRGGRLRLRLRRRLPALGEAVHRGEERRAAELRAQTAALEAQLRAAERDRAAAREAARRAIARERARAEATGRLAPPPARSEEH